MDFKHKYLKYKLKYLELKKQGGNWGMCPADHKYRLVDPLTFKEKNMFGVKKEFTRQWCSSKQTPIKNNIKIYGDDFADAKSKRLDKYYNLFANIQIGIYNSVEGFFKKQTLFSLETYLNEQDKYPNIDIEDKNKLNFINGFKNTHPNFYKLIYDYNTYCDNKNEFKISLHYTEEAIPKINLIPIFIGYANLVYNFLVEKYNAELNNWKNDKKNTHMTYILVQPLDSSILDKQEYDFFIKNVQEITTEINNEKYKQIYEDVSSPLMDGLNTIHTSKMNHKNQVIEINKLKASLSTPQKIPNF